MYNYNYGTDYNYGFDLKRFLEVKTRITYQGRGFMEKIIYLVVPCYNEEEVIPQSSLKLETKLKELIDREIVSSLSRIVYVDDGSRDNTWNIITKICSESELSLGIKLNSNCGQQLALWEGINFSKDYSDAVITIDCDLQDDIEVIDKMIDKFYQGNDIVYGVHSCRKKDSFFKKVGAYLFYKIAAFFEVKLISNHSEFRLMSASVMEDIINYGRERLPIRCYVSTLKYPSEIVKYSRQSRTSGTTKYTPFSLFSLGCEIIIGFSSKPIPYILVSGIVLIFGGIGVSIFGLFTQSFNGTRFLVLEGLLFSVLGVLICSIGVVGSYLLKILHIIQTQSSNRSGLDQIVARMDSSDEVKLVNNVR